MLAPTTPVCDASGKWRPLGEIHGGDVVLDAATGEPAVVAEVRHDPGWRWLYRLNVASYMGAPTELLADAGQRWQLGSREAPEERVQRFTLELLDSQPLPTDPDAQPRYFIPHAAPAKFTEKALPVGPALLGAWLAGDKATRGLKDMPRAAGFDPKQPRIPEAYLTADIEHRWALLQGIADTIGKVENGRVVLLACDLPPPSDELSRDLERLLWSLGGTPAGTATWLFRDPVREPFSSARGANALLEYRRQRDHAAIEALRRWVVGVEPAIGDRDTVALVLEGAARSYIGAGWLALPSEPPG